jgi:hypothetical protein
MTEKRVSAPLQTLRSLLDRTVKESITQILTDSDLIMEYIEKVASIVFFSNFERERKESNDKIEIILSIL